MLDISSQISDASVQECIQPESSGFVRKGESGDTGPIGAFGRLLAGLLRKNQSSQPRETEASVLPEASADSNNGKKTKPVLAGFRVQRTVKNQDTEELASSRKPLRPEKNVKKTDREEQSLVETAAASAMERGSAGATDTVSVADAADSAEAAGVADSGDAANTAASPEARLREIAEKEAVSGLAGKKPEKTNADAAVSPEKTQFSPVFSGKKEAEETRRETAKPESSAGNRNRRKDRVTVEVQDQRTNVSPETSPDLRVQELSRAAERELTVELRPVGERAFAGEGRGVDARNPESLAAESGGFASLLAEQLAGDLSPDIVKQAAIVLRDGGEGTIRLSLKPETLGKVKIHLEMAENKISGHILVESEEALRAFEKEIHTLEQAFRDSGFTDASLDTALSGNGGGRKGEESIPFFSERFAVSSYDSASELRAFSGIPGGGFSTVDLLV
jgi:flagellar hook-length control protein FliK